MFPKILAVLAVLALSPLAARASEGDPAAGPYSFDTTRAMEPAPSAAPVATWQGGGYDPTRWEVIPATDAAEVPALVALAQLWTVV
jgi:hypothetical protein